MFEWLEAEIAQIKTPRFHLIDGPANAAIKEAIIASEVPCPWSYKNFVIRFGNSKLYRRDGRDSYRIVIWGAPRKTALPSGEIVTGIGNHDGAIVYLQSEPQDINKYTIYEYEGEAYQAAESFEKWLSDSCVEAKKLFTKERWEEIIKGPEPFSDHEIKIVNSRRQCHWRISGIDNNGDHVFEFTNGSSLIFRVFTIGIRSKSRHLNGAVYLKVGHIGPGMTGIACANCYKELVPSHEIEAFNLPDPEPENRAGYREFDPIY